MRRIAVSRGAATKQVPAHTLDHWARRGWHPATEEPTKEPDPVPDPATPEPPWWLTRPAVINPGDGPPLFEEE